MFEYELIERAKSDRRHIVLPEGIEERILRAAEILQRRDAVEITLLGDENEIQQKIATLGLDLKNVHIENPLSSKRLDEFAETYFQLRQHKGISREIGHDMMTDVNYFGTMMVHKGLADGLVSGAVKVREATHLAKERRPDLKIEGPLQYDAAIDSSVAATKMPDSEVAGHATVFIFPDLNTGNNTYKAVQRSANAVAIGPVLQGLNKPVNDLSRGCTVTDIVNTVAITAIQAQARKKES
jgi:phosphotransacetylase